MMTNKHETYIDEDGVERWCSNGKEVLRKVPKKPKSDVTWGWEKKKGKK